MIRDAAHALLTLVALMASAAAAQSPPAPTTNPWNVTTASPPAPVSEPESPLSLRVYDGFDGRRPGPRGDDNPFAVDVSAVMTRCADGSLIVTALVIGGRPTPLDNHCPTNSRRPDPVGQGQVRRDASPATNLAAVPCDAARWNCSTSPAP